MEPLQFKGKWLLGTTNIRWGIKEIIKLGSGEKSFFAKKRIESFIAFGIAEGGLIYWFILNVSKMSLMDISGWAILNFGVAGYMINHIQKEKKAEANNIIPNEAK